MARPHLFHSGKLLEKCLRRSLAWKKSQREVATMMSNAFDPATVDKWRKMRDEFDLDGSMPNPYEEPDNRTFSFLRRLHLPLTDPKTSQWLD